MNHAITGEEGISIELFHTFLLLVLAIFVEDFGDKSEIDNGESMSCLVIADVLEFEITVTIANLVENGYLWDNLHADVWDHLQIKDFGLICLLKALLDVECIENVFSGIGHHDLTERVRKFGRNDYGKTSVIFQVKRLYLLQNFEFFFESDPLSLKLELLKDDFLVVSDVLPVFGDDVVKILELTDKYGGLAAVGHNSLDFEQILM